MQRPHGFKLYLRFVLHLAWEFRWPVGVFVGLVLVCGLILHLGYHHEGERLSYVRACYVVFMLIFVQPAVEFPDNWDEWFLVPFFFLLPIVGLGAIADSIVRLAYLIFAKKQRLPEWQRMVASMYRNHIVVVGVGKLGMRIIQGLVAQRELVVAIEMKRTSIYLDEIRDLNVPVIIGNGRQRKVLAEAGVAQARSLVTATDDDLANMDAALTARDLNPQIRVTLRMFDDTLAAKFGSTFDMPAISASQVSAPAFIAAATGRKVHHQFQLDGNPLHLIDLTVRPESKLAGELVGPVQQRHQVNVVFHRNQHGVNVNPGPDVLLNTGDLILVIGQIERLLDLEAANQSTPLSIATPVVAPKVPTPAGESSSLRVP
jgi:Trk K+ transport system NAD-binding subunit